MVQRMRPVGRLLAGMLALALVVVSSATCLLAAETTPAQKACCAAMNHDCGAMAIEQGCCATESPSLTSLASSTPSSLVAPPALVPVGMAAAALAPPVRVRTLDAFDLAPPIHPSRPTYLFVSVFRL